MKSSNSPSIIHKNISFHNKRYYSRDFDHNSQLIKHLSPTIKILLHARDCAKCWGYKYGKSTHKKVKRWGMGTLLGGHVKGAESTRRRESDKVQEYSLWEMMRWLHWVFCLKLRMWKFSTVTLYPKYFPLKLPFLKHFISSH